MIKETITIEAQVGKAVKGVEDLTKQIEDLQKQQKEQGDAAIKQAKQQVATWQTTQLESRI